ncbi:DNA topoisomerase III [Chryseobacterium carnipullorum]|uniref:DNA topoisomerase III n=1 Tax=Chryseobacterium carnipullorum TaxID=1124835 RepID=A0A376DRL2_CHRCU|nr:DNA topoisomerase [Chryseobacterium carnipullorum]STC93767.1 DNA topoisomerase III [Chryseobacterium carnipullorum]
MITLKTGQHLTDFTRRHKAEAVPIGSWASMPTQALSIAAGNGIYSLGRVQTPTLVLICKRYLENKNFSVKRYWQIQLSHNKELIDFKSISKTKWEDQKLADDTLKAIRRSEMATVTS